jgi:ribose transport system substrate-binding protein
MLGCAKEKKAEKIIGVSLLTKQHIFYKDLEEGLKNAASKYKIKLIIQSGEFDLATQTSQIEDFITQKVDAIIVCPVDSSGIGSAINSANKAGIPVFTADIAAKEGEVVSHIASDNVAGGRIAGEYMAEAIGRKGEIAIIDHPTVTSVQERVRGFKEAISKYPNIKIVAQPTAEGQRAKATDVTENLLQAHPNLKGIFGINDDSALGALAAVKGANRKDIIIIGYDATPEAQQEILSGGPLKADVIQYPKKIGETTIETVVKYLEGEKVPKLIPVEVGIVDKKTLEKEKKTR